MFRPLVRIDALIVFRIWAHHGAAAGFDAQAPTCLELFVKPLSNGDSIGQGGTGGKVLSAQTTGGRFTVLHPWEPHRLSPAFLSSEQVFPLRPFPLQLLLWTFTPAHIPSSFDFTRCHFPEFLFSFSCLCLLHGFFASFFVLCPIPPFSPGSFLTLRITAANPLNEGVVFRLPSPPLGASFSRWVSSSRASVLFMQMFEGSDAFGFVDNSVNKPSVYGRYMKHMHNGSYKCL